MPKQSLCIWGRADLQWKECDTGLCCGTVFFAVQIPRLILMFSWIHRMDNVFQCHTGSSVEASLTFIPLVHLPAPGCGLAMPISLAMLLSQWRGFPFLLSPSVQLNSPSKPCAGAIPGPLMFAAGTVAFSTSLCFLSAPRSFVSSMSVWTNCCLCLSPASGLRDGGGFVLFQPWCFWIRVPCWSWQLTESGNL